MNIVKQIELIITLKYIFFYNQIRNECAPLLFVKSHKHAIDKRRVELTKAHSTFLFGSVHAESYMNETHAMCSLPIAERTRFQAFYYEVKDFPAIVDNAPLPRVYK